METTITPEPEEYIENAIVSLVSSLIDGVPVEGTMNPAPAGEAKHGEYTYINVKVGQTEQLVDSRYHSPLTFSVRINVHVAANEDKGGTLFRDVCRGVRAILTALTGDGCASLNGDHADVHAFTLDSTDADFNSSIEGGEFVKTYNASLTARIY